MTKTTGNITSLIIVPRTLSTKQNYVDLDGVRENKDTETQELDIGIATSFVSHAWGCSFSALVDTLVEHSHRAKQAALPTPYYWLDIFCKNQHVIQGDETAKELTRAVEETGSTLLMCDGKWFQPKCFTRVWCLYEIMWTLRLGSKLRVILPSENVLTTLSETSCETSLSQSQEMSQETRLDFSVLRSISDIDVLNAEASVASDKQMIFDWIEASVGCESMSHEIGVVMCDAMAESLLDTILALNDRKVGTGGDEGDEGDEGDGRMKLVTDTRTIRTSWRASQLLAALGWMEPAMSLATTAVQQFDVLKVLCLEEEASSHSSTDLSTHSHMKTTLLSDQELVVINDDLNQEVDPVIQRFSQEMYSLANQYFILQLSAQRRALGIAKTNNNKQDISDSTRELRQIVAAFRSLLKLRTSLLGLNHRETLGTCNNLANALLSVDNFAEARHYHDVAYNGRRKKYGDQHEDTLQSLNNIGSLHDAIGSAHYQRCCDVWVVPPDDNAEGLSALMLANEEWQMAVAMFRKLASAGSPYHMKTIQALKNAATDLLKQVDEFDVYVCYDEALECYQEALKRLQKRYGSRNPHTLRMANTLARAMHEQGHDAVSGIALLTNVLKDANIPLTGQLVWSEQQEWFQENDNRVEEKQETMKTMRMKKNNDDGDGSAKKSSFQLSKMNTIMKTATMLRSRLQTMETEVSKIIK